MSDTKDTSLIWVKDKTCVPLRAAIILMRIRKIHTAVSALKDMSVVSKELKK